MRDTSGAAGIPFIASPVSNCPPRVLASLSAQLLRKCMGYGMCGLLSQLALFYGDDSF